MTGIDTDIGKTTVSAVLVEALKADYWKPIQAGDLDNSDSHKVRNMISNLETRIFPSAYELLYPMSPHASADREGRHVDLTQIRVPETQNTLIIEGAGGLLVPLNHEQTLADWIPQNLQIIVVVKHYLGSINHSLLTLEALKRRGLDILGIIVNGDENPESETIIEELSGVRILGRVGQLKELNKKNIASAAQNLISQENWKINE